MNTELFKSNKYTSWYYEIINKALNRTSFTFYMEKHHIIPKCMGGIQTVKLTAREHFICHLLLTKMVILPAHIQKMNYALWLMSNCTYKPSSNLYESIKSTARNTMIETRRGVKKSPSAVLNMRLSRLGKKRTSIVIDSMKRGCKPPSRKGVVYSEKQKQEIKFLKKANKILKCYCSLYKR